MPKLACRPCAALNSLPCCALSVAEVGADRRQLQTATRGQQPVPGQPHCQERGPERGGVRPSPVTTVEVLTQPAAIRGPQGPPSTCTPAELGDHVMMFLKLSAKLYTSVFHHGLKVLRLKSPARHELGQQLCRRGNEPLGLRTEGPSQGWHPLPPTFCFLLTPQQRNSPVLAGTSGQAATMFISRTEGAGQAPSRRELNNLQFVCFLTYSKSCV